MTEFQVLNTRAPRLDAPAKATGRAKYADDLSMPGMLYAAILQSPLPHAKILHIDTSKALKLPGVKAVITAKEAGLVKYGVSPARYDETLFAHDKVRYVGDEIAALAAVDQATAQEALSLIKVDYEELPAVFDMFEAMKEGAPQIHDEFPGNHDRRGASGVRRHGSGPWLSATWWWTTRFSTNVRMRPLLSPTLVWRSLIWTASSLCTRQRRSHIT